MCKFNLMRRGICFLLIAGIFFFSSCVSAETFEIAKARDQHVRVYLTRLNLNDRLDLTLNTSFLLETPIGVECTFRKGSSLSFLLSGEDIYLYYGEMAQKIGESFSLKRIDTEEKAGWQLTNFSPEYLGDLHVEVADGKLRPVLTIHVEDYLLGVVPYEMGNDFPLEALKAQAVAARTYALRKQNSNSFYDVYDNTNDQVFRGYVPGNDNAEQAIFDTAGVCGFFQNKLAQCFYSASNGGQTELVQTVWPGREELAYYAFGDDPYDVENNASTVRSLSLLKKYQAEEAPYALRKLIAERHSNEISSAGYDASAESIRIEQIASVSVDSPNMKGSKRMTMLHIEADISVRTRHMVVPITDVDTEEVSLFNVDEMPAPATTASLPAATPAKSSEPVITYGAYTRWPDRISIDIPIFPDAEQAFGLSINSNYENEIWQVVEAERDFTIEVRRFGHGVGMSQRGAQVMAEKYDMTFREILGFYYPGMDLKQYPVQERLSAQASKDLLKEAGPAPSPTPRPTLMPVTQPLEKEQWYAAVTEIDDNSSLNLRSAPSLNGDIIMRLYKGQRLLVLDNCAEDGWVNVRTDVIEGYVMEKYLSRE